MNTQLMEEDYDLDEKVEITKEHYEIAKKNGIGKHNVWQRVNEYFWSIERAITEPVKKYRKRNWSQWRELAEKHGVSADVFYTRVSKRGMTPEQAATTPMATPQRTRHDRLEEERMRRTS